MVEKLVLHIGATKTGTSAIQSALACDREALLANGVLYPEDEATDGKAQAGRVSGGNGALFRGLYGLDPKSSQKALKKFEESIRSLVSPRRSVARPPSVVVFSHERIGGIDPKLLAALKAVFSRHFDHVQIIYYVRHLADHAISQYGEYVKRRRMKESFNNFAPKYQARFKKTMGTYESVFDRNDIQYVLYDDVRDNLYRDFLQRIGVRSDPNYRDPEQVNRSLTGDEIEVLRHVNRMGLSRTLVAKMIEDFAFRNKQPKRRPVAISRASIDAIAKNNEDVIAYVNARLSGGSVLRAASDTVVKHAADTNESKNAELDPEIMRGLLESGVRVVERDRGKLDPQIVFALRESDSRLRAIAARQSGSDPQTALRLLESGLRLVEGRYNAESFLGSWKTRFQRALRTALNRPEPGLDGDSAEDRKAQKRLKLKKQPKSAAEDADARERKLKRKRQKKAPDQGRSVAAPAELLARKRK